MPSNITSSNLFNIQSKLFTMETTEGGVINLNNSIDSLNNDLSFVTSQIWDGALSESSHITSIGNVIYTSYPLWLILTSIILLLAMVGAIVITIKQK